MVLFSTSFWVVGGGGAFLPLPFWVVALVWSCCLLIGGPAVPSLLLGGAAFSPSSPSPPPFFWVVLLPPLSLTPLGTAAWKSPFRGAAFHLSPSFVSFFSCNSKYLFLVATTQ